MSLIKCPLLYSLRLQDANRDKDAKVLARRRLGNLQLLCDVETANAVINKIAVNLLAKMRSWVF